MQLSHISYCSTQFHPDSSFRPDFPAPCTDRALPHALLQRLESLCPLLDRFAVFIVPLLLWLQDGVTAVSVLTAMSKRGPGGIQSQAEELGN